MEAGLAALQEVHGGAAAQGQEVQRRLAAAAAEVGQARQQLAAAALERLACQREVTLTLTLTLTLTRWSFREARCVAAALSSSLVVGVPGRR